MKLLKTITEWFKVIGKFTRLMPANIKLTFQAIQFGLKAFVLAYKAYREAQFEKIKREITETSEKIQDPSLTFEERLKLNAQMESHFKHFVSGTDSK